MIIILLENFKIAFKSLMRNKIRSFLTILGIVIGVFAVIAMVALVSGLEQSIVESIAGLGADVIDIVPGKDGEVSFFSAPTPNFTIEDARAIKKRVAEAQFVSENVQMGVKVVYGDNSKMTMLLGTSPDYFSIRRKSALAGELFTETDLDSQDRVAVLGKDLAKEYFEIYEKAIGRDIKIDGQDFEVIGVLEEEGFQMAQINIDQAVYVPSKTALNTFRDAFVSEIFLKVEAEDKVDEAKEKIKEVLINEHGTEDFVLFTSENMLDTIDKIAGQLSLALTGVTAISLLVGGIGIMNIMLVSVTERTREIGIRKAVGATDSAILLQFLIEAVVLCFSGGLFGVLLAEGVSEIFTHFTGLPTLITWQSVLAAFGFSTLVGVLFGTFPAVKASKQDPIEALRYE